MQNNELRKMRRTELIEIIYAMQQNEKTITAECEELRSRLEERNIQIEASGSIAEAALTLNQVFENADKAAQQYLASVKSKEEEANKIVERAEVRAKEIISAAEKMAEDLVENAKQMTSEVEELFVRHSEIIAGSLKKGQQ